VTTDTPNVSLAWTLGIVLGVIALGLAALWVLTGDIRARTETRRLLVSLADSLYESEEMPQTGPIGVLDVWGREIRHSSDHSGHWIKSAGPDGTPGNQDDLIEPIVLTPLGELLYGDDPILRSRLQDPDAWEDAAKGTFGEPVSLEISSVVVVRSADSGEVLYQLDLEEYELEMQARALP
jgi:hypothetical protein